MSRDGARTSLRKSFYKLCAPAEKSRFKILAKVLQGQKGKKSLVKIRFCLVRDSFTQPMVVEVF